MREFERIAHLRNIYEIQSAPGIELGIGDDAAILASGLGTRDSLVWTVDAHVEGVHFRRDLLSWRDEGFRSFVAAASDLAAMGADPKCALSSLTLPRDFEDAWLTELARGIADAARACGAPIVGGNLAASPVVTITTTLLGSCPRPVTRKGARAGDGLWIAGNLGLARAGLMTLDDAPTAASWILGPPMEAWCRPRLLFEESRTMREVAHAAIDVSDGLAQDAGHIAEASAVHLILDADAILQHGGAQLASIAGVLRIDALDLALDGGEDYALLAASAVPIEGFTQIGEVLSGPAQVSLRRGSTIGTYASRGFDHFHAK